MRTTEEVAKKINEDRGDIFGFTREVLLEFLPFELVKSHLKDGVTEAQWEEERVDLTPENVINAMQDYMAFAWTKVEDHRGMSAGRSITKMQAWLWLLEDDDLIDYCDSHYAPYGAPALKAICEKYHFAIPAGKAIQRMVTGEP